MQRLFLFITLILMAMSCLERPDCIEKRNNIVGITFKNIADGKAASQQVDSIKAEGNSEVLAANPSTDVITVPLDYIKDTTYFTITLAGTSYPLTLAYTSKVEFVSEDCGERFRLDNLSIVKHEFDSVAIVSALPGINGNARNIVIFR